LKTKANKLFSLFNYLYCNHQFNLKFITASQLNQVILLIFFQNFQNNIIVGLHIVLVLIMSTLTKKQLLRIYFFLILSLLFWGFYLIF